MHVVVLGVNGVTGRAIASELSNEGCEVVGTGRDIRRFPASLRKRGVRFVCSDRRDPAELGQVLAAGADVIVDCLCYTAEHARQLLAHRESFGSVVVLSSKAVYVDDDGRHANSEDSPRFDGPVPETQPVLEPDFSGTMSREGYGTNKVAAEITLRESGAPVSVLRASRIHGRGGSLRGSGLWSSDCSTVATASQLLTRARPATIPPPPSTSPASLNICSAPASSPRPFTGCRDSTPLGRLLAPELDGMQPRQHRFHLDAPTSTHD